MLRIDRPPVGCVPDLVACFFLALDRAVMARLAYRLQIVEIDEHIPIAAERFHVMHSGRDNPFLAREAPLTKRLIS